MAGEAEAEPAETGALEGDGVDVDEYRDEVGDEDLDDDMPDIEDGPGDVAGAVGPTAPSTPTLTQACSPPSCRIRASRPRGST